MFQGLQLGDDGTPLACIKPGPNYNDTYKGLLEELQEICPLVNQFLSWTQNKEDTADSDHEGKGKPFFTVSCVE